MRCAARRCARSAACRTLPRVPASRAGGGATHRDPRPRTQGRRAAPCEMSRSDGASLRLAAVSTHLASTARMPSAAASRTKLEHAADVVGGLPVLLDASQMASFVSKGFHCVDTRSELPTDFHEMFAAKSYEINQRPRENPLQDVGFLELEADIATVLRAPSVHGALISLLGPDFTMACAWAEDLNNGGMMGNHHTDVHDRDQPYHKDGIHTPASVVRDIKPRGLILMYYPNGATLEQGPTAIVPGSHSFMPNSDLISSLGPMPESHEERDRWLLKQANSFGDEGRQDFRVVVPAGAVLMTDYHMYHRASRNAGPDAPWRPNVKMGAARISEPLRSNLPSWKDVPVQLEPPLDATPAVHESIWAWLAGDTTPTQSSTGIDEAAQQMRQSKSEVERMEAAHRLASAAACGCAHALKELVDAFDDGVHTSEKAMSYAGAFGDGGAAIHRASKYGLCSAGPTVTPAIISRLTDAVAGQQWQLVPDAAYVIGQCSAPGNEAAVCALASALRASLNELLLYTRAAVLNGTVQPGYVAPAGNDPKPEGWETVDNDVYTHSRRTAAAELCCALGLLGHQARRVDAVPVTLIALDALLLVLCNQEPGCAFRADGLWNNQIRTTAGTALLRICSDPVSNCASMPLLAGIRGQDRLVKGMVVEALHRATASAGASGTASEAVLRALEHVAWPWEGFRGVHDDCAAVYVPFERDAAEMHLQATLKKK